ncbi:MAG: hypothetical protein JO316_07365 [Abitibacteriaceae bacterium]|nr:hypothetical protein [Abditibacteriaceae bacterium]
MPLTQLLPPRPIVWSAVVASTWCALTTGVARADAPPNQTVPNQPVPIQPAPNPMQPVGRPAPWKETPLWKNIDPAPPQTVSDHDMQMALINSTPILSRLRDWRDTARGRGQSPRQEWKLGSIGQNALELQVGAGAVPAFALAGFDANVASVGLKLGKVAVGSTAPNSSLNNALRSYDAFMAGAPTTPPATDGSQMTWLTARPVEGRAGKVDLLLAQGKRDLTPGQKDDKKFAEGTVYGAGGDLAVTSTWRLHGEWLNSQLSEQDKAAAGWKVGLEGPLRHPWGEAKVSAAYNSTEAGFAPFAAGASTPGAVPTADNQNGQVTVQQDVAIGKLKGTTQVAAIQTAQQTAQAATAAPILQKSQADTLGGKADLRFQVSPSVALLGKHEENATTEHALTLSNADNTITPAPDKLNQNVASDVGVELKLSHSLALAVTTGQTRTGNSLLRPGADTPDPVLLQDENRTAVSLQRKTGGGMWGISVGQRAIADALKDASNVHSQDLQLQAERQLFSWLRLKGAVGFSNQNDIVQRLADNHTQRSAEAQLALPFLGRFNMKYSDADGAHGPLDAMTNTNGSRQYGISYNLGNTDGKGGLGLAVEYAKQEGVAADSLAKWRVGITYR